MANYKVNYKNANIQISTTKSRCKTLVGHINNCCDEITIAKLKHKLQHEQLTNEEKTKLQNKVVELSQRVVEYKKHKKTKYHI